MKRLLIGLAVVIALLLGTAFALPYALSTDAVRDAIRQRIEEATGYDVKLSGNVHFSILPWIKAEAESVSVEAPDGNFEGAFERMDVAVTPGSLFSNRIEITGITLIRPRIALAPAAPGSQSTPTQTSDSNASKEDRFASIISLMERLSVRRIAIEDGHLVNNATPESPTEVSKINLVILAPDLDGEASFDLSAVMDGRRLAAKGNLSALRPILTKKPAKLTLKLSADPPFHPKAPDVSLSGTVELDPDGYYRINDGTVKVANMTLRLAMLYQAKKRPFLSLSIAGDTLNLDQFRDNSDNKTARKATSRKSNKSTGNFSALTGMDAKVLLQFNKLTAQGVTVAPLKLQAALQNGVAQTNFEKLGIAGGALTLDVSADLRQKTPILSGLIRGTALDIPALVALAGKDLPVTGKLGLNLGFAARGLDGAAIADSLNIKGTVSLKNGAVSGLPDAVGSLNAININTKIAAMNQPVVAQGTAQWRGEPAKFTVELKPNSFISNGGGPIKAALKLKRLDLNINGTAQTSGSFNGKAKVKTASLGGLMTWLGQGGSPSLGPFAFNGGLAIAPGKISFNDATVSLNKQTGHGSGRVTTGSATSIIANLAYKAVDLSAFSGDGSDSGSSSSGGGGGAIDLSALRGLTADIKLSAKQLAYGKIKVGPASSHITVKNGVARMSVPNMGFYDGKASIDVTADGSQKTSALALNLKVNGANAQKFLRQAADFKRLDGILNLALNVKGTGSTVQGLKRSLAGSANFRANDGAIRGIDVAKIYKNIGSLLGGKGYKAGKKDKTTFAEFSSSFAITQGIAQTSDMKLLGPLLRMSGAGKINVAKETLNMRLDPKIVASLEGQGSKTDVSGVGIPVIIKGPWANPKIYPDLSAILKNPKAFLNQLKGMGLPLNKLGLKSKAVDKASKTIKKVLGDDTDLGEVIKKPKKVIKKKLNNALGNVLQQGKIPKNPLKLLNKQPAPQQQGQQQQTQDPATDLLNQGLNSLFKKKKN